MASTNFRNKNNVRPKKKGHAKNQRNKQHAKRLVDLGMPEEQVRRLNAAERRFLLRHPVQTAAALAEINSCECGCGND